MKKFFSLLLMTGFSIISHAQCSIIAPSTFYIGQTYTFTASNTAQCSDCYDWDINNSTTSTAGSTVGNLQITSPTDTGQSVSIKILSAGTFSVQLTYFDETGCHSCSFTPTTNPNPAYALPTTNCFAFDPVNPLDVTTEGTLNFGHLAFATTPPITGTGLTFTWYFKLQNGNLVTYDGQNPTFREICPYVADSPYNTPENAPVMSFALIVSNGIATKQYRDIDPLFPIPGFTGANTCTTFTHGLCNQNLGKTKSDPKSKIIVSPNPTSSILNFEGEGLENYRISIYDANGNKVIENAKIDKPINIANQKKGMLIYKISNEKEVIQDGKIIKE